ncbi:acyl carrier protein [Saccharothrix algeriensis]|uniref:Acyl carrier protein n=1 Tax=Saccharothrix algeriensis TaxID=173560 RepID=A0A8T8HWC0_9PSEU|nr:acyl carrier protein [Saccharothrix algeriensis]MBM7814510.1 acyl carrier protein [Saccharothrix algeriensis]QTR02808.1 acyl carrier protein [Saccharothrix algeriensis]
MADDAGAVADAALDLIAGSMGLPGVRPEQPVAGLHVDSVTLLRVVEALQERFDITVDVVDVFSAEVVGDLVRLVEEAVAAR